MKRGLVLFSHVLHMLRQVHTSLPPLTMNTGLMLTSQAIMREVSLRSSRKLIHLHDDGNVDTQIRTNSPLTCNPTSHANAICNTVSGNIDINP